MALRIPAAKPHKYRAEAVVIDGLRFTSKAEGKRYAELKMLERGKAICDLRWQVPFEIVINGVLVCKYIADFTYTERGAMVVEDVKSPATRTDTYLLKRKLMKAVHGIDITEVTRS